jgi:hypothetical protein
VFALVFLVRGLPSDAVIIEMDEAFSEIFRGAEESEVPPKIRLARVT